MGDVKQIFESRGWTGKRLAAYFGVSKSHISHILHGRSRPKVLQIVMARLIDMSPEVLWGDSWYGHTRGARPSRRDGTGPGPARAPRAPEEAER